MNVRRLAWILIACAGCIRPSYQTCGDDLICPNGTVCDLERNRCLDPLQVAACADLAEGDACVIEARAGTCRGGACEQFYCGDGYISGNEACDGTDLGGATCIDAGFYAPDGLACGRLCTFDTSACGGGECGDGVVSGPELCDGNTMQACVAIGFDGGAVGCDQLCGFSIRDCSRFGWNPEALQGAIGLAVGGTSLNDQWVVGAQGRALRYQGAAWNLVPTGTTADLLAIWSITANDVWVVARGSTSPAMPAAVLHWNGTAWTSVTLPAADYVDVWAAGSNSVYVATRDAGVLTWNGTVWSSLGSLVSTPIAIRGSSSNDIWVTTEQGPLAHWTGAAWVPVSLTNANARYIDVNAPDDVWIAGTEPVMPSTAVTGHWNGTSWTFWRRAGEIVNAIASSAPNDTWLALSDGVMRHFDGVGWAGTASIGASPSGLAGLSGLFSLSSNEVVAVSTLGLAYRYRGQTFGTFPPLGPDPFSAFQNTGIWGAAVNDLYVTNLRGEVSHYDGTAWSVVLTIDPSIPIAATAIWGRASDDVWVATGDGRVFHFNGSSWTPETVTAGTSIRVLWGSGADVWAFGAGSAYHRVGGTWEVHLFAGSPVISASGTGSNDIWAIERTMPPLLHHWNGVSWAPVALPTTVQLNAVLAVAPDNVFVAAANGRILRWNGVAWSETLLPAVSEIRRLGASAFDDVVAASDRELFHFNGNEWSPIRIPADPVSMPSIADVQVTAGRIDFLLDRYRLRTLIRTRPLKCRNTEVNCSDSVDDNCNGLVDGTDSQCP